MTARGACSPFLCHHPHQTRPPGPEEISLCWVTVPPGPVTRSLNRRIRVSTVWEGAGFGISVLSSKPAAPLRIRGGVLGATAYRAGGAPGSQMLRACDRPGCRSTVRRIASHPKHPEPCLLHRRIKRRGERQRQHAASLARQDNPVVPQPRGGVVRAPFGLDLVADRRLERRLLVRAPAL